MVYHNVYVILNFLQTQSNNSKPTFIQIQFWKKWSISDIFPKNMHSHEKMQTNHKYFLIKSIHFGWTTLSATKLAIVFSNFKAIWKYGVQYAEKILWQWFCGTNTAAFICTKKYCQQYFVSEIENFEFVEKNLKVAKMSHSSQNFWNLEMF